MGKILLCVIATLLLGPLGLVCAVLWICLRPRQQTTHVLVVGRAADVPLQAHARVITAEPEQRPGLGFWLGRGLGRLGGLR